MYFFYNPHVILQYSYFIFYIVRQFQSPNINQSKRILSEIHSFNRHHSIDLKNISYIQTGVCDKWKESCQLKLEQEV